MKKLFSAPFIIFILIGTIIPTGVIAYYGVTDRTGAFSFENIMAIASQEHFKALFLSLLLSITATLICLVLAFPLGVILRESNIGKTGFIVFLFILPMWMNFVLRTMAWQVLLEKTGPLGFLGIINTQAAVILGMVYDYLPFMVLPVYNAMIKIDDSVIEAAYDLGASKFTVLLKIIFPLSIPGIVSGVTMVFVPSLTTFAVSNILGGGKVNLIGNIIEQEFTTSNNWNLGSGLSLIMMIFIVISMILIGKFDKNGEASVL